MAALADEISLYYCEDGTEFPVLWPTNDAPRYTWRWNEDHHPLPYPPLTAAIDHGPSRATIETYAEADIDPPPMFRGFTIANGFQYARASPLAGDELASFVQRSRALSARWGGACNVFEGYSLPRIVSLLERLRGLPAESPVEEAADLHHRAFHLTHVGGPAVFQPLLMQLQALLAEALGPEARLLVQEIVQGAANDTIASDQAIWEMAQMANVTPERRAVVAAGHEGIHALALLPAEDAFRQAFDAYVETHRYRAENWDSFSLTVGEDPGRVLMLVRNAMNARSPAEATATSVRRREVALARVSHALAGRSAHLAGVQAIAAELEGYVGMREGRARWQLIAAGSLRHALLAKGTLLAERRVITTSEDVFLLLPEEVDRAIAGAPSDYGDEVETRRTRWEYWKAKRPPVLIGAEPTEPLLQPIPIASTGPVLRGIPASRGTVTARVRVLGNLDQADTFEPGEVLVCAMTSPPWTPLFAIAAAVVTDSGAPLSHPAIAAREYGIPCVVGAKDASRKLRTGMRVTVDGLAGTVTIEE
ncbi:MAG TPA: PEP-utilizing enzyme [Tepidiformaceae bacterium]|nr:PEP-utilizing enzyme [Tepidiformaceae bacterium]